MQERDQLFQPYWVKDSHVGYYVELRRRLEPRGGQQPENRQRGEQRRSRHDEHDQRFSDLRSVRPDPVQSVQPLHALRQRDRNFRQRISGRILRFRRSLMEARIGSIR